MKRILKKILKPIKKTIRKVGGFFGRIMNKLGPVGMFAMMLAMPALSNFWATMGNAIGGTAAGGTAAATAGTQAAATAVAEGTAAAGSSAAANIGAAAGKEVAKKAASGLLEKTAATFASGTGQATGLFAGGTASKALGYTLKTLHNVASASMNVFSTVSGAVNSAVDFVSGGSMTKFSEWVGDRFGDFQSRVGMQTDVGYKKRLNNRLATGNVPADIVAKLPDTNTYKKLYNEEGMFITSADNSIIKGNLPSFQEQRKSGSLLASNDPNFARENEAMFNTQEAPADLGTMTVKPTASDLEYLQDRDSLLSSVNAGVNDTLIPDIESLTEKSFASMGEQFDTLPTGQLNDSLGQRAFNVGADILDSTKRFFVGGERTFTQPAYERVDGKLVYDPLTKNPIRSAKGMETITIDDPNIIERLTNEAGNQFANAPQSFVKTKTNTWIKEKVGLVPTYIQNQRVTSPLGTLPLQLPREDAFIALNSAENTNNNQFSANPFIIFQGQEQSFANIDYGQGGFYGA